MYITVASKYTALFMYIIINMHTQGLKGHVQVLQITYTGRLQSMVAECDDGAMTSLLGQPRQTLL